MSTLLNSLENTNAALVFGVAGGGSGIERDPTGRSLGSAVERRLVRLLPDCSVLNVAALRVDGLTLIGTSRWAF
jgi:hypothetical protein